MPGADGRGPGADGRGCCEAPGPGPFSRNGGLTSPSTTEYVTLWFPYVHLLSEAFRIKTLFISVRHELSKKLRATVHGAPTGFHAMLTLQHACHIILFFKEECEAAR